MVLFIILFSAAYVLVPFFMTRMFQKYAIKPQWLTYIFSGILLLIYPDLVYWISSLFKAPLEDGQYLCMFPPILINVLFLPIAMGFQLIFNRTGKTRISA